MVVMDLRDVLRDVCGAARVQFLLLSPDCTAPEASATDYQFREQLYEQFDYPAVMRQLMALVPDDKAIDFKDSFGVHYIIFPGRGEEQGSYFFLGPLLYHSRGEAELQELIHKHALSENALTALHWYFKRIPVIRDVVAWRQMLALFIARYLGNPGADIVPILNDRIENIHEKNAVSLSAIPYTSIEARYATETKMLEAIRRGDISEATYQQNLFMGYAIDQRISDSLRNAKDMVIAASAAMRKAVQQAEVHPLYIDGLSGELLREIEEAENEAQLLALSQRMVRQYCVLVQTYSRERYSGVVRDALNYVDFHYMEPLSLESLALKYAVNKNYLSTRFSREVGMTLTDYINLTRVRRSLKLLSGSTLSMPEIAERCGFSDANYYTRTFRKIHGSTPTEYRRSLKRT